MLALQGDPRWAALGIETVSHSPEVRRPVTPSSCLGTCTDAHTPQDLRKFLDRQLKTLNTE